MSLYIYERKNTKREEFIAWQELTFKCQMKEDLTVTTDTTVVNKYSPVNLIQDKQENDNF